MNANSEGVSILRPKISRSHVSKYSDSSSKYCPKRSAKTNRSNNIKRAFMSKRFFDQNEVHAKHGGMSMVVPDSAADASPASYGRAELDDKKVGCVCSPTTHPGSFRCRLHRRTVSKGHAGAPACNASLPASSPYSSSSAQAPMKADHDQQTMHSIITSTRSLTFNEAPCIAKVVLRRKYHAGLVNTTSRRIIKCDEARSPSRLKPSPLHASSFSTHTDYPQQQQQQESYGSAHLYSTVIMS